jgi:hypothetical protein
MFISVVIWKMNSRLGMRHSRFSRFASLASKAYDLISLLAMVPTCWMETGPNTERDQGLDTKLSGILKKVRMMRGAALPAMAMPVMKISINV